MGNWFIFCYWEEAVRRPPTTLDYTLKNLFMKTLSFTFKPWQSDIHYNYLINTSTVALKLHPINTNGINTLREEIDGGRHFCGIYFCDLEPQNQRFLLFDRFRKTLRHFFLRLTPTRKKFAERDFVMCLY